MHKPIHLRIKRHGDIAEIRVQLNHPMLTGLRPDEKTGKPVPANFIQTIQLSLNDKTVIESQMNPMVSRNPSMTFKLKGAKPGDKLSLQWTDNKGKSHREEATIL